MQSIDPKIYEDLIGKEFKFLARGPDFYDCLGLVYIMMERLNIDMPHQVSVIDRKLRKEAFKVGKELFIKLEKPEPACLVTFRVGNLVSHIGVILDRVRFIHIAKNKRVCIEKINDLKWSKRIDGFYIFAKK